MKSLRLAGLFVLRFVFRSVVFIPIAIYVIKALDRTYGIGTNPDGTMFISGFIEWFGVLYGILLPLILVRVWEQLDMIDREFDREADAVKLLYEDVSYLRGKNASFAIEIAALLRKYVEHIIANYRYEIKASDKGEEPAANAMGKDNIFGWTTQKLQTIRARLRQFLWPDFANVNSDEKKIEGDKILEDIRAQYKSLISLGRNSAKDIDPFVSEIFKRLNEIIDIRGDRIGLASQRLFESLRLVALITSIIFVLPFYFVGFESDTPLLNNMLIAGVTVLVIFIYLIIEDFDEPFGGTWRITVDSWKRVLAYMNDPERKEEMEKLGEKNTLLENQGRWRHNRSERLKRPIEKRRSITVIKTVIMPAPASSTRKRSGRKKLSQAK